MGSWVRAPAESQREFSMRALFFLLVGLDDLVALVALVALVVLAVLVYLVHLV